MTIDFLRAEEKIRNENENIKKQRKEKTREKRLYIQCDENQLGNKLEEGERVPVTE